MQRRRFYYLIRLQYLGFRYSGWQKQPEQKTIEQMLLKTLKYITSGVNFKILGAGRTDAKVSALDAAFELFIDEPISDLNGFQKLFNKNLPPDIRITGISETNEKFNIIQNSKVKEYAYLFSFGAKNHPFAAPFIANLIDELDIDLMMKAAKLFEGEHDFSSYTARIQENTQSIRRLELCEIRPNRILHANFFPKTSYVLHVKGKGFMRYQIRMMMGALIQLGKGELCISDIENSLLNNNSMQLNYVAPGSGLLLNELHFEH
ncbi:tRNA pseudouridine(38-40) synthase TruA [Maribacter algarum]|uniref:tRNA pseudouridine synthase A n=1 Tax=Maribacter algarum (ex Zhang et al. 2020) TaxID=2578118 RepID=A0A5S3PRP0_9FLAO|nr:tRNA pseudouridine(38-40) synthase TruA [Maribacter algarum]TMM57382.1 tRNA pseudouridine(38-40) synthase TruA [Maribacter algarum]